MSLISQIIYLIFIWSFYSTKAFLSVSGAFHILYTGVVGVGSSGGAISSGGAMGGDTGSLLFVFLLVFLGWDVGAVVDRFFSNNEIKSGGNIVYRMILRWERVVAEDEASLISEGKRYQ